MPENSRIIRDAFTKAAVLRVCANDPWRLYAGKTPETIDYASPVLHGQGPGVFALPSGSPGAASHAVFAFSATGGTTLLAERRLPISGGYNFRDMGGFPAAGGKSVAWGKLFRGGDLRGLTPQDSGYLASIPIARVVDFRTEREITRLPDILPSTVSMYKTLSILPGSIRPEHAVVSPEKGEEVMRETYRLFVTDPAITAAFREFFDTMQDEDAGPLLFHCAAGKDRTGFAAALALYALGVAEDVIMRDYLASTRYLVGKFPSSEGIFSVQEQFLRASLQQIGENYGSMESYLTGGLGINIGRLRSLYLR